jgi:hydroxymethylpyrimidine/phosphomethylpyrimidine kinase
MTTSPPIVLCFSGSDPSGGAGIQADITAIHYLGAHAACVITAITVQNTQNVFSFIPTQAELLLQQADAIMQDMPIKAIKIGMLGSVDNVLALSKWLQSFPDIPVVLDPVTVANSGGSLGEQTVVGAITQHLLPRATIVTPNIIEAHQFAGSTLNLAECAQYFLAQHCPYVLIKGSHANTDEVTNVLYHASGSMDTQTWPRLPHRYHGSGCTLASSIAAFLAHGLSLPEAVQKAQAYTWECLANAYQPGKGQYIPQRYLKDLK